MWTIDPVDTESGDRFFVVSLQTSTDEVRLTVTSEREARTLRDTLNEIAPAVSAFAL